MVQDTLWAVAAAVCLAVPAVRAQDAFNMVGTWTGEATGVVLGDAAHFDSEGGGTYLEEPRFAAFELTITVTGQEDRYFWGTISGGGASEPWLGHLWADNSGYRAVDSDGYVAGRVISENEIENCYTHTGDTSVASCATLTRQ